MEGVLERRRRPSDAAEKARALSEALRKRGSISTPAVAEAFARVDRSVFLPRSSETCAYDDAPLRSWDEDSQCVVHLSAPSIYATALEALELTAGRHHGGALSFLNVGSGAGYLSALAATLLGKRAVHHCVEISAPLAARCKTTFDAIATDTRENHHHRKYHTNGKKNTTTSPSKDLRRTFSSSHTTTNSPSRVAYASDNDGHVLAEDQDQDQDPHHQRGSLRSSRRDGGRVTFSTSQGVQVQRVRGRDPAENDDDDDHPEEEDDDERQDNRQQNEQSEDEENPPQQQQQQQRQRSPCDLGGCRPRVVRRKRDSSSEADVAPLPFGYVPEVAHVRINVASCFELAVDESMRFDRIYVGAGARASDARLLSRLLKPGGIIVGPFERDAGSRAFAFGAQSLLKATRDRDDDDKGRDATFQVEELMAVQFAPLSRRIFDADGRLVDLPEGEGDDDEHHHPAETPTQPRDDDQHDQDDQGTEHDQDATEEERQDDQDDDDQDDEEERQDAAAENNDDDDAADDEHQDDDETAATREQRRPRRPSRQQQQPQQGAPLEAANGLRSVRTYVLRGPTWGVDSVELFAQCFVDAVDSLRTITSCQHRRDAASRLPWHVWQDKILSYLAHDDVLPVKTADNAAHQRKRRGICGTDDDVLDDDADGPRRRRDPATNTNNVGAAARRSYNIVRAVARWTLSRVG
mmetsp:Transcript_3953/g.12913  ORF Transcript_3953/g.12913 Transcript_3953/m.12913 type:complete len:693 (-) Transcript_3953:97-2175(-)